MFNSTGRRGNGMLMFILNVIFALYFLNAAFSFITLPAFFDSINKWIFVVGGILLVIGGINSMRLKRYTGY